MGIEPDDELARMRAECEALRAELVRRDEVESQREAALAGLREVARFPGENPNPVLRLNAGGVVLYANEASRSLLQEWGREVHGVAPEPWPSAVDQALAEGTARTVEAACAGRDYSFVVTPLIQAGYVNLYGTDITELRRTQERLETANQELRARGEQLQTQNRELERLLAEVEAQRTLLDIIIENLPVGIGIAEAPSGRLLRINEQTRQIWRLDSMEAVDASGYGHFTGFHPDGREYATEDWQLVRALKGDVIHGEEVRFVRGDGTRGVMRSNAAPVRDRDGHIVAAVVAIDDITPLHESQQQLQAAYEELRLRGEELAAQNSELARARDELASLLSISHHVASELELEPLLRLVLDEVEKRVGYTTLAVYGIEGEMVSILDYRGPKPREEMIGLCGPLAGSYGLATVVAERAPLVLSDVNDRSELARTWRRSANPRRKQVMPGAQSWMAVPLVARGRVIGVLRLAHDRPGYYDEQKVRWGLALADPVAVAIDNARLYGQARELAALEERQRLARDLHDVVSQTLFSASLTADVLPTIYARDPEQGQKLLDDLRRTTRGAMAELRALLVELRPQALLEADLGTLLTHLADAAAGQSETHITVTRDEVCPLPQDVQVALYRIAQEALHNVAKHAKAGRAAVHLVCAPEEGGRARRAELCVEDDGRGFDLERVPDNEFGLSIMAERARAVGADLTIDSRPGAGTRVTVVWEGKGES